MVPTGWTLRSLPSSASTLSRSRSGSRTSTTRPKMATSSHSTTTNSRPRRHRCGAHDAACRSVYPPWQIRPRRCRSDLRDRPDSSLGVERIRRWLCCSTHGRAPLMRARCCSSSVVATRSGSSGTNCSNRALIRVIRASPPPIRVFNLQIVSLFDASKPGSTTATRIPTFDRTADNTGCVRWLSLKPHPMTSKRGVRLP
jgi:hypothetical protein